MPTHVFIVWILYILLMFTYGNSISHITWYLKFIWWYIPSQSQNRLFQWTFLQYSNSFYIWILHFTFHFHFLSFFHYNNNKYISFHTYIFITNLFIHIHDNINHLYIHSITHLYKYIHCARNFNLVFHNLT